MKRKVYAGTFFYREHGQVRGIIAATQKDAAKIANCSLSHIREYWSETGNDQELKIALENPGKLFWCSLNTYPRVYSEVEKQ